MEKFKISCDQLEGGMPRISVDFRRVKMCVVCVVGALVVFGSVMFS